MPALRRPLLTVAIVSLVALCSAAGAVYYFAPGLAFQAVMRLARRYARLQLREVTVGGHVVPYLEGGRGEPLLLLHGFAANKDHWTLVAPYLTRHYRVIAPDLPGFGDASRHAAASYDLDTQVARIAAFAEALGLARFHLGGNSMGGYLAAFFTLAHPERVTSLWLLAPAGVLSAAPSPLLRLVEAGENPLITRTAADFDRALELCFVTPPPTPARFKLPLLARAQAEAPFNEKILSEMFAAPRASKGRRGTQRAYVADLG